MDLRAPVRCVAMTPILLFIFTVFLCIHEAQFRAVNILLLTPKDNKYLFSIQRVYPAIKIALEKVQRDPTLLKDRQLKLHVRDTQCTDAIGMNYAIEAVWAKKVDAFLGLVCDYVLAPIIRQDNFWNLPLITAGANAWDFVKHRHTIYPLLTRVGPVSNPDVAKMFRELMDVYKWRKIKLIYEKAGRDDIVKDSCHFFMEVLILNLKQTDHVKVEQYRDTQTLLKQEIGLEYSGDALPSNPYGDSDLRNPGPMAG